MNYLQLQEQVKVLISERGWDLIPASMAMIHLTEELGELAEQVQTENAVKLKNSHVYANEIAGEIADAVILLIKMGIGCNVDLTTAISQRTSSFDFRTWKARTDEPEFTLEQMPQFVVCLLDRLGELCRHIMFQENYKNPNIRKHPRSDFAVELAFTIILLVRTGEGIGINMDVLLEQKMEKAFKRFSSREGNEETFRYLNYIREQINKKLAQFAQRF